MTYLYEHREQLGEYKRFAEIAYSVTHSVNLEERDDVEQLVVIELIQVSKKVTAECYLWKVARHVVARYWESYYRHHNKATYIEESNRGEIAGVTHLASCAMDDGRLDATLTLSTLPPRMVEIGLKKLNGEKLTDAERLYTQRHRKKLNVNGQGHYISEDEVEKIVELKRKGLRNIEIVRITGRSVYSVKKVLSEACHPRRPSGVQHQDA